MQLKNNKENNMPNKYNTIYDVDNGYTVINSDNIKNYGVKPGKKYKTKKRKLARKLIAIGLGIFLLSGILNIFKDDKKDNKYIHNNVSYNQTTTNSSADSESITLAQDDEYVYKIEVGDDIAVDSYNNTSITASESSVNYFITELENKKVNYKYEHLYNVDYALENYNRKETNKTSNVIANGKLSSSLLFNLVKENNNVYLKDKSSHNIMAKFEKIKDKDLKIICDKIAEVINNQVASDSSLNINKVTANFKHLKIVYDVASFSCAYVNEDLVLAINEGYIENIFNINERRDTYDDVIVHEIMHLIQYQSSNMNEEDGVEIGPFVSYPDSEKVNPLNLTWILESSAEENMANYLNVDISSYKNMIGYLKTLNLSCILDENVDDNDVYNVGYTTNLDSVFKLFGATTSSQKKDVINCLFNIQIAQTDNENFYKAYEAYYGINLKDNDEERLKVKKEMLRESLLQLTKNYYKNLAVNAKTGKMSLEDSFYLMRIWEADMMYHLEYNEEDNYEICKDFLVEYKEIQDLFFSLLSNSTSYNVNDLYDMFNNYSMKTKNGNNYALDFLNKKEIEFIKEMEVEKYSTGIPNINEIDIIMTNKISK